MYNTTILILTTKIKIKYAKVLNCYLYLNYKFDPLISDSLYFSYNI